MSEIDSTVTIGPKKDFFAWLPNCIVYDWGLSAQALGVALYLHGKPAGWRARPFDIQKHFKFGDHTWRKISKELKGFGLLHERKVQSATELWFELPDIDIRINQKPSSHPLKITPCENHTLRKPTPLANKDLLTEKELLTEKDILCEKTEKTKTEKPTKQELTILFMELWEQYPLKKGKQAALAAFIKSFKGINSTEALELATAIIHGLKAQIDEHGAKQQLKEQGGDIWVPELPHLSTWLNQKRWEDGYQSPEQILNGTKRKKTSGIDLAAREQRLKQFNLEE